MGYRLAGSLMAMLMVMELWQEEEEERKTKMLVVLGWC